MKTSSFRLSVFLRTPFVLLFGLVFIVAGVGVNYFFGLHGTMLLQQGHVIRDMEKTSPFGGSGTTKVLLDLGIRLDSLVIDPYTPEYQIEVWKEDTAAALTSYEGMPGRLELISTFALEKKNIRRIGDSDFRFRLSEFYPNFQFEYSYPERTDTIPPIAPGVMLNLKTTEGDAIATLRTDQPGKHKLADLFGFGAPLEFYWEIPSSIITTTDSVDRIVFAGRKALLYFYFNGRLDSSALETSREYKIPGRPALGFTLKYLFPDAAYLKAIPSTDGKEVLNPVAAIHAWIVGGGYKEIFLYPDSKSGSFQVPGTPYMVMLSTSQQHARQFQTAFLSLERPKSQFMKSLVLSGDQKEVCKGYRLQLERIKGPGQVRIQVLRRPGNVLCFAGAGLLVLTLFMSLVGKPKDKPRMKLSNVIGKIDSDHKKKGR